MARIIDKDIVSYTAFLENVKDSCKRCYPELETKYSILAMKYEQVLNALIELRDCIDRKVQVFDNKNNLLLEIDNMDFSKIRPLFPVSLCIDIVQVSMSGKTIKTHSHTIKAVSGFKPDAQAELVES